ncbi:type VII secretion integral membrane protein EccD [Actinocatenispora thailandica]|nr:type VII secretion integral membrane protein EccD [Actinocatenispora thailandica]
MTAPVGTSVGMGLARVTVSTPKRRIDVALPEDIPVAELVPNLLRHAGENAADEGELHGGWVLRRSTGALLVPTRNLAAQGVRDGEVLHLVPRRTEWPELEYDDVVETIASGARRYGRSWGAAATRRCAMAVSPAIFLLGTTLVLFSDPPWLVPGIVSIGLALVLTIVGIALARAMSDAVAGAVLAGSGLPFAFLGGFLVAAPEVRLTALGLPHLLLGSVLLLVFGVIGYVGVGAFSRLFAAAVTVGLLGGIAGLLGFSSMPSAGIAAVVLTIGIALMPGYPLMSLRIGKLPLPALPQRAEDMLADPPMPQRSTVYAAVARSDEVLTGTLLGVSIVALASMAALLLDGAVTGAILVLVGSVAMLLRARLFPTPRQRVSLLAGGIVGIAMLAVAGGIVADSNLMRYLLLIGVAAVGALVLVAGMLFSKRPPSPYLGRFADIFDVIAIIALVPITCSLVGLYSYIRGVFASFG